MRFESILYISLSSKFLILVRLTECGRTSNRLKSQPALFQSPWTMENELL